MIESKERAKDLQRQYLKAWRKKNPDKVRQYNKAYWERKAQRREAENEQTATE